MKQGVHRIDEQIGIFEIGEHEEVHTHTQNHPESLPAPLPGIIDQVPQVVIGEGGEDQDQEKESGSFPVKKEAGHKKKDIPGRPLTVYSRIDQQHNQVESPEKETGEYQRLPRIKEEYVRE